MPTGGNALSTPRNWIPTRIRLCLGITLVLAASGCVERRYTIRTNPPGALVYVNGEEVGTTPVSRSFTYYGDREITLVADGYQTQRIIQPMPAPWWDNAVTDFFTENLVPFTLRDDRDYVYNMQPTRLPGAVELQQRANQLRGQGQMPPPPRRRGWFGGT
jgi:hypothetical protein